MHCVQYLSREYISVSAIIALPLCVRFCMAFHEVIFTFIFLYLFSMNSLYFALSEATGTPRYISYVVVLGFPIPSASNNPVGGGFLLSAPIGTNAVLSLFATIAVHDSHLLTSSINLGNCSQSFKYAAVSSAN